jgi:hypothetical protein
MVIPGEQVADLEKIDTDYYERWTPVAPNERFRVDVLIHDEWRRLRRVEASLLAYRMQSPDPLLSVYRAEDKALDRFGRIMHDIGRSAEHAVKELKRAKARPIRRPAPPNPARVARLAPDHSLKCQVFLIKWVPSVKISP